jgi:L-amino acid N-acyltransferase YncA
MKIRSAHEEDLENILRIYNYSIVHTTSVYTYDPFTFGMMKKWFGHKQEEGFPIVVAEIEGEVVGYASYGEFRNWPAYKFTVEHSVHIDSNYRRKGIAKKLLDELIHLAKSKDLHSMVGCIDADNKSSIDFHENLGFKEVAHMKEVGYKFDRWLDLKIFQLILNKNN